MLWLYNQLLVIDVKLLFLLFREALLALVQLPECRSNNSERKNRRVLNPTKDKKQTNKQTKTKENCVHYSCHVLYNPIQLCHHSLFSSLMKWYSRGRNAVIHRIHFVKLALLPTKIRQIRCSLQWRHNVRDSISNHQPRECLLSRLIRRRSKKTSKLRVTGLCAGNSPEAGEFPAQRASNAENIPFDDVIMYIRKVN